MIDHIVLAVLIQLIVRAILRNWWAGAATSIAWAISREITQAEYRWIEHYGGHLRANMPWWGGLDPRVWQYADPWLDWIAPSITVIVVATIAQTYARSSR